MDEETKKEWEKSKRIEAERMKAARELEKTAEDKTNLAFLDPNATKVKGWSNDPDVILSNEERMGNRAIILAFCGVVLDLIGSVGEIVSSTFNLGLGGVIFVIPTIVGLFCIGLAALMAIVAIGCEIYFKAKRGRKFNIAFWSSIWAIIIVILYVAIKWLINRFG